MRPPALPLPPMARYRARDFPSDLSAAATVCFLAVPQGLAYATIAGLPPAMGLYAAAAPTIVGSLFRSSKHVVAGPTNALSLLVGAAVATGLGGDPVGVALTLALMIGALQVGAGLLRLGAVVDYISVPVVLGYITGAAVLIGAGQLYNVTNTTGPRGTLLTTLGHWAPTASDASGLAVAVAVATVVIIFATRGVSRRIGRRIPGAVVAMIAMLVVNVALGLEARGLRVVADLSPIPESFPTPGLPPLADVGVLLPVAVAGAVLSLVESTAVARSIAARTGQRLDASTEFVGQGLSNLTAGLWGGYPVSGSLSRSAVNERSGAKSRIAGIATGAMMFGVVLAFGSVLDHTPIASLAGLLLVVAWDLVDVPRLVRTVRASKTDAMALAVTVVATWTLSLDTAIYLGVGISIVAFLRRSRTLAVHEVVRDARGRWQDRAPSAEPEEREPGIRVVQLEGPLFFGAATELVTAIDDAFEDASTTVVILRLKRAQGMDATVATTLAEASRLAVGRGDALLLCGLSEAMMTVLERSGANQAFAPEHLLRARPQRFASLDLAWGIATAICSNAMKHDETRGPIIQGASALEAGATGSSG
ncbi:MAG: SulP family inorganic anion transporter [Deltaproteobacteria bacterium]|nr:SulP family inorganic anion transporter [Deltaproteobacteria bacterium]